MIKICPRCKQEKDINEFRVGKKGNPNFLFARCKICEKEVSLENYYKHKEKYILKIRLKKSFTTEEWYNITLKQQDNKCAICNKEETVCFLGNLMPLSIDHCHNKNKPRGLLCARCNSGLGFFMDKINNIENAIKYLLEYD